MIEVNATISSLSGIGSYSGIGWLTTIIVVAITCLILTIILKNFWRTIFGGIITAVLLGIYKVSRWIGISTQNKDYVPVTWFVYIAGFVIISIILGWFLDNLGIIKKIDNMFKDEKIN